MNMATSIAANAWVDPRAEIDEEVVIGPFCTIGAGARIGRGTRLHNNVTLMGNVTLGADNVLFPNVVIGAEPQDYSYRGSDTAVIIGDGNTFREGVTVNRASEKEDGVTRIGDNNFLMGNCHVAHDCKLGSHILIANGTLLAGHVHVHDYASLSGGCTIHQFVTVGSYSFISALSRALHDVPPCMLVEGIPARPRCINIVALKRNNFSAERIEAIASAHRLLYRSKVGLNHARELMRAGNQLTADVEQLFAFIEGQQVGKHGRGREVRRAA
jgi:UDP-N-acetylglucosamine acyltransferase